MVNFLITFSVLLAVLLVLGVRPGLVWLSLVPVVLVLLLFSLGLGMILAILNVFFRDVGPMFSIVMQLWFWCTPIVYPISILPQWLRDLLILNPMVTIVQGFQQVILHNQMPDFVALSVVLLVSLLVSFMAMGLYSRRVGEMVDEL